MGDSRVRLVPEPAVATPERQYAENFVVGGKEKGGGGQEAGLGDRGEERALDLSSLVFSLLTERILPLPAEHKAG